MQIPELNKYSLNNIFVVPLHWFEKAELYDIILLLNKILQLDLQIREN
jgi:hypothetical protein